MSFVLICDYGGCDNTVKLATARKLSTIDWLLARDQRDTPTTHFFDNGDGGTTAFTIHNGFHYCAEHRDAGRFLNALNATRQHN